MTQRERELLNALAENPMISQQELADKLGITRSSVAVHISHLTKKGYIAGKGYVLRSPSYAVVVGGVNMDIGGRSNAPLVDADSNPGVVRMSLGGVGRNIAHNMALLGSGQRPLRREDRRQLRRAGHRHLPRPHPPRRADLHLSLPLRPRRGHGLRGERHGHL